MFYKTLDPGSIGHREAAFLETAELAAKYGFKGYWFSPEKDFTGNPLETRVVLEKFDLIPAGFGVPVDFRGTEEQYQADLKKLPEYLDFAEKIGIRRCITWILPASNELTFEENFDFHKKRLTPIAEMLKEKGIFFGLEFLGPVSLRKGFQYEFIHTLDGMLELCDAIGTGNVGILLDAWHWDLAGQKFEDFKKFTSPEMIVCAHVMDAPANIPMEEQNDIVRRMPGTTGILRIEEFFAGLKMANYDGPVLAEPFEAFLESLSLEDAIKVTAKALDRVWMD